MFDIGNVLVRWDPLGIVEAAFGLSGEEAKARCQVLFGQDAIWHALNRGEHTEEEAKRAYIDAGHLTGEDPGKLFAAIYESYQPIDDTLELMKRLHASGYRLFALTDNVREVVAHFSQAYSWWAMFEGVTNSAELGCLKPDPRMYRHVLETNGLVASESVFLDDMPGNVAGAHAAGMHAFVFTGAAQAEADLRSLGVELSAPRSGTAGRHE